jgi:hypothetical protein
MSPATTALLTHVLIGASILFIIAYIGNRITFSNRFVNALVTAAIFAVLFGALAFIVDTSIPPELMEARQHAWLDLIVMSAGLVFVIDLVANMLSFSNRLTSAFVTAVMFAVLFAFLIYATGTAT